MAINKRFSLGLPIVIGSVVAVVAFVATSSMGANVDVQSPGGAIFSQIPGAALSGVGATLSPLSTSQVGMVKVTAAQAMTVAQAFATQESETGAIKSVTEGSFTDVDYRATDAEGAYQPVVVDVPAYVITISGLKIASDVYSNIANNTEDNVVVNATTGNVILSFTYL